MYPRPIVRSPQGFLQTEAYRNNQEWIHICVGYKSYGMYHNQMLSRREFLKLIVVLLRNIYHLYNKAMMLTHILQLEEWKQITP